MNAQSTILVTTVLLLVLVWLLKIFAEKKISSGQALFWLFPLIVAQILALFPFLISSEPVTTAAARERDDQDGVLARERDQEHEADELGVRYLGRAGYDPRAMADFLAKHLVD